MEKHKIKKRFDKNLKISINGYIFLQILYWDLRILDISTISPDILKLGVQGRLLGKYRKNKNKHNPDYKAMENR